MTGDDARGVMLSEAKYPIPFYCCVQPLSALYDPTADSGTGRASGL